MQHLAVALASLAALASAQCPGRCSGHGECGVDSTCACFAGYAGPTCGARTCPEARPWASTGAELTPCASAGRCDRGTGECACDAGYTGQACERTTCASDCSGHGRCLSMAEAGAGYDGYLLNRSAALYDGATTSAAAAWDAHRVYGCVCDPGFGGPACTERLCDVGDDARTAGGADEKVVLHCACGAGCAGSFRLRFMTRRTPPLPHTATAAEVAAALQALAYGPGGVATHTLSALYKMAPVTAASTDAGGLACTAAGARTTVTFNREAGDLPLVDIVENALTATASPTLRLETVHTVTCTCAGACQGTFTAAFDGNPTAALPHTTTAAELATAVAALDNLPAGTTVAGASAGAAVCVASAATATTLTYAAPSGNLPALELISSVSGNAVFAVATADGSKERDLCNAAGTCDFATGLCACDEFHAYQSDYGSCGKPLYNTSGWAGPQRCAGVLNALTGLPYAPGPQLSTKYLYWTDEGSDVANFKKIRTRGLHRFDLDPNKAGTTAPKNVANVTAGTAGVALDLSKYAVYYTETDGNKILRGGIAQIDTRRKPQTFSPATLALSLDGPAHGLALDLRYDSLYLYWTQPGTSGNADGKLKRVPLGNLVASAAVDLTAAIGQDKLKSPRGIALDYAAELMYWVDSGASGTAVDGAIYRAKLDGTSAEVVMATHLSEPYGLALDLLNHTFYVTDVEQNRIVRGDMAYSANAHLYASWAEVIVTTVPEVDPITGLEVDVPLMTPFDIVLDRTTMKLHWSDPDRGKIFAAGFDGALPVVLLDLHAKYKQSRPLGLALDLGLGLPFGAFVDDCYGHGTCQGYEKRFKCLCDEGWMGNCAMAECPKGPAWFDEASANDVAHGKAECSNAGTCDRATGLCKCLAGFTGAACHRRTCPTAHAGGQCSGAGECVSAVVLGERHVLPNGEPSPKTYALWDSEFSHGCSCASFGYNVYPGLAAVNGTEHTGHDCAERGCPTGDDPKTASTAALEQQTITCAATGGTVAFRFRKSIAAPIAFNANAAAVKASLLTLASVGDVTVAFASGSVLCDATGATKTVTFKTELGDVPLLAADAATTALTGGSLSVAEAVKGTKENVECSNRGVCEPATGMCHCFDGFSSSDGSGALGSRGDCGHEYVLNRGKKAGTTVPT